MGEVLHWFYEPLTVVLFMATVNITRSGVKEVESLPYTGSLAIFLSTRMWSEDSPGTRLAHIKWDRDGL